MEEAVKRTLNEETGLEPVKIEQNGVERHVWPEVQTVTVIHRVEVTDDNVTLNPEHNDYKWIDTITEDLHPYVKRMIEIGRIFTE